MFPYVQQRQQHFSNKLFPLKTHQFHSVHLPSLADNGTCSHSLCLHILRSGMGLTRTRQCLQITLTKLENIT